MPEWLPEWLRDAPIQVNKVPLDKLAIRLLLALALGVAVAFIYRFSRPRHEPASHSFFTTLVMLTMLIALVTEVIGGNIARAFSLVGALSIVRFRTVVADTRDTAFVIFAVVLGMAAGAGYREVTVVALILVGSAALVLGALGPRGKPTGDWLLTVRVGAGTPPDQVLHELFPSQLDRCDFAGAASARQGVALDLKYRVRLKTGSDPAAIVAALNQREGVQQVDLSPD